METQVASSGTGSEKYTAFPGQGRPHDEELARLRRENAALRMERDVLKKTIVIFRDLRRAGGQITTAMKYASIHQHRKQWPVSALCRILGVSRSGYFAWCQRSISPSASAVAKGQQEARLLLHIQAAHRRGRFYYGSAYA